LKQRVHTRATGEWELGRRPALDGLRAIAIIAVIGVHVSTILAPSLAGKWFVGGLLGVNMFFVLSGFLITALLLQEHRRTARISLTSFWRRRSLRLFPALYAVLIVQLLYTAIVHDPIGYTLKGDGLIVGYVSNWAWAYGWPQPFGLSQTWSLGVEEQFYVVWPLLLIALLWMRRTRLVPVVASAVAVGSALFRWHLADATIDWVRPIAETPAELDSIMAGALLAWALHAGWRPSRTMLRLLVLPAVCFLGWQIQTYSPVRIDGQRISVFGHLVVPVVAVCTVIVILAALEPNGIVYRVLVLSPLRWIGRLSYSLYLWHVPVFVCLVRSNFVPNELARAIVGVAISFTLATASYYLIERPFVARAHRRSTRQEADLVTSLREPASVST